MKLFRNNSPFGGIIPKFLVAVGFLDVNQHLQLANLSYPNLVWGTIQL